MLIPQAPVVMPSKNTIYQCCETFSENQLYKYFTGINESGRTNSNTSIQLFSQRTLNC